MIARLNVRTPFKMFVPIGAAFQPITYDDGGCEVTIGLPSKSDFPAHPSDPVEVKLGTEPAMVADCLTIEFKKPVFDVEDEKRLDPPVEVVQRALDFFTSRLRYVCRAPQSTGISFPGCFWHLVFLDDDGSPLAPEKGSTFERIGRSFSVDGVKVDPRVYLDMWSLPDNWTPPLWYDLLLEAEGALDRPGFALVLSTSALEVFVSSVLDQLAAKHEVPAELWAWITERKPRSKNPSSEEQFDSLLEYFTGHSLKTEEDLWKGLLSLRTARHQFVHGGEARLEGKPLSREKVTELVGVARRIVARVREWLPEEIRWVEFGHTIELQASFKILGG